jgi:hypothetical protein
MISLSCSGGVRTCGYLMSLPSVRKELNLDDMREKASWPSLMKTKVINLAQEAPSMMVSSTHILMVCSKHIMELSGFFLLVINRPQKNAIIFREIPFQKLFVSKLLCCV